MIDGLVALEAKATRKVTGKHLRGLQAFGEEAPHLPRLLVSLDENDRVTEDGIRLLSWRRFIELRWGDRLKGANRRMRPFSRLCSEIAFPTNK